MTSVEMRGLLWLRQKKEQREQMRRKVVTSKELLLWRRMFRKSFLIFSFNTWFPFEIDI